MQPTKELLEAHYADLSGRSFFNGLVAYMMSGPVVGMVWVGRGAVKTGRVMLGTTNPADSAPGTIRGDFAIEVRAASPRDHPWAACPPHRSPPRLTPTHPADCAPRVWWLVQRSRSA